MTKKNSKLKFIICSIIGIFLFFISININGASKVPMVHIMGAIQNAIGYPKQFIFVVVSCIFVLAASIVCKFVKKTPEGLKKYYKNDNLFSYFTYVTAVVFSIMIVTGKGPEAILNKSIGNMSMEIAADSFAAIMVAGTLVAFITEFGFLEFLGKILEPLMKKIFKVPGKSAVDALSSFVIAPAAGVMVTNDLYNKKVYTKREAAAITTNFSIASLGGFAFLSSIAGIGDLFTKVVIAALICCIVLAIIMIRIPPIKNIPDTYIDDSVRDKDIPLQKYSSKTIPEAWNEGVKRAESTSFGVFVEQVKNSFMFGIKVNAFIVSLSVIGLIIATYTPVTEWIAVPMAPVLKLFGLADAETIAASSVVGVFALSLPATLIKGKAVAAASAFFIVVLSTCQIVFFTESANAMMESDIPLNFGRLIEIFIIRTILLIPLVALLAHIMI